LSELNLVTLSELKEYLGITTTSKDDLLTSLIEEVSDDFESHCNRKFACPGDCLRLEYHDIEEDGIDTIQVKCYPISSIVALCQNYVTGTILYTPDTDYIFYSDLGQIKLRGSANFPTGKKSVVVTYYGGFCSTIPSRLVQAAKREISSRYNDIGEEGLKKEKIGNYSYEKIVKQTRYDLLSFDPIVERILNTFRDIQV